MIIAALLLATVQTAPATAMPAPGTPAAPAAAAAAPAPAASRLSLDTPVETILADPKGKAVIDANLPQLAAHPSFEMAKSMSLNQIKGYAPEQFPETLLAKISTELAAVK